MVDYRQQEFTQPDDLSDVSLVIQGQKLYAHRVILAEASPVWHQMLMSNGKPNDTKEIDLPEKKYEDVLELLKCIYPSVRQKIYDKNVMQIIPLADEYHMEKLKEECEDLLLIKLHRHDSPPRLFMNILVAAQNHTLSRVMEKAAKHAAKLSLTDLEGQPEFHEIDDDSLVRILRIRIRNLEAKAAAYAQNYESWIGKTESLTAELKALEKEIEQLRKIQLQKEELVSQYAKQMKDAWDLRGLEARCENTIHRYGDFDYACSECNEFVRWYIERKSNELKSALLEYTQTAHV